MARADGLGQELDPTDLADPTRSVDQGDTTLFVRFFSHPHQDPELTLKEGRPIYHDREYIEIVVPGDKDTTVNRPVRPGDRQRFPKQYSSYKSGDLDMQVGTPLSVWSAMTRAQVEELKYFKIHTVEQLAGISDNLAQKFLGINRLKQQAKDFMEAAKGSAATDQLRNELDQRDAQIAALQNSVAELMAESRARKGKKAKVTEPTLEEETEDLDTDHTER